MKFLAKKDLSAWIEALLKEGPVVAPTAIEDLVLFRPIEKPEEIVFGRQSTLSCKGWFFSPTDVLFTMERNNGDVKLLPTTVEKDAVIFGLSPCDAQGLAILDKPFMDAPADALYAERRARTALIGIACSEAGAACFCTSMGGGPQDASNLDIILFEVEGGCLAQPITEEGEGLLGKAQTSESDQKIPEAPELKTVAAEGIMEVARRTFNSEYWDRLADRCLHCNTCSYVCPVCYCFDVRDYDNNGKSERIRTWESCQSAGFTRIAGGYSPRPGKGARMRQRFCHKLLYFPERYGMLKCTGCGRCVTACPVNIDIREVIQDLQTLTQPAKVVE